MESLPEDFFVTSMAFTKHTHRDVYPAIDPSSPTLALSGKVVIVTGISRGIGRKGLIPALAKAQPKAIVLVARDATTLSEVAEEVMHINDKIEVLQVEAELSNGKAIDNLFNKVGQSLGPAQVLIHVAGVSGALGPLKDAAASTWWHDFEVNGLGYFLLSQAFAKQLPDSEKGTIVAFSTGAAYGVYPGLSAYSISKLVGLQLNAYMAAEHPNIAAIALHPGIVKTDMTAPAFERFALDKPELAGATAVYLCSDRARWLSGKFVNTNWDMDELEARKEEVLSQGLLTIDLKGKFGPGTFP